MLLKTILVAAMMCIAAACSNLPQETSVVQGGDHLLFDVGSGDAGDGVGGDGDSALPISD